MKNEHRINTIYKFLCMFEAQLYLLSLDEYTNPIPHKEKLEKTLTEIKKEVEFLKEENAYSPHLKFGVNKYLKMVKLLQAMSTDQYTEKKRPIKKHLLARAAHDTNETINKILTDLEEVGIIRSFESKNLNNTMSSFITLRG